MTQLLSFLVLLCNKERKTKHKKHCILGPCQLWQNGVNSTELCLACVDAEIKQVAEMISFSALSFGTLDLLLNATLLSDDTKLLHPDSNFKLEPSTFFAWIFMHVWGMVLPKLPWLKWKSNYFDQKSVPRLLLHFILLPCPHTKRTPSFQMIWLVLVYNLSPILTEKSGVNQETEFFTAFFVSWHFAKADIEPKNLVMKHMVIVKFRNHLKFNIYFKLIFLLKLLRSKLKQNSVNLRGGV